LWAVSGEAARRGLRRGQALADAKALEPRLHIASYAPDSDQRLLGAFARWCGRWSPWTAADPGEPGSDGVLLEISGCAHLFGGEDVMIATVLDAVRGQGFTASAAIAPTLGLAWGMARKAAHKTTKGWLIADEIDAALAPLPVTALRIGTTAATLKRFGLKTVGDLIALPRDQLTRRFGRDLLRRLDQATGREEEILNPLQPKTPFRTRLRFAEALLLLDSLKKAVSEAAITLCEQLEKEGRGLTRLTLNLYRVDGKTILLGVGTAAPARDPAHITRLFNEKLDRAAIDIGFGVDVVELIASETAPMTGRQDGLMPETRDDAADLACLTDRLVVRLGEERVKRAAARQSHLPERASGWRPGNATKLGVADNAAQASFLPETPPPDRPLLILARPEPAEAVAEIPDGPPRSFTWRRVRHQVTRAEGPERLAPEWWRQRGGLRTRDYFRVETEEGRRFWLYREGLFGLETNHPTWFVHGAS
jgi:protein ImuB